jgi:choice-of-anchor A domain-containing protein
MKVHSFISKAILVVTLASGASIGLSVPAFAEMAGVASDYNVFLFGDWNQKGGDSQGKVAVGGNANLQNVGIADRLNNSNGSEDHLVVDGNLTMNGGQVFGGNAVVGGTASGVNFNCSSCSVVNDNAIDFTAAKDYYTDLSNNLANLETTGTSNLASWGGLTLTGNNQDINVFEMSFNGVGQINLNAPSDSELIVINVTDEIVSLPSSSPGWFGSMFYNNNGSDANLWSNVIWNFANATEIDIQNIGWKGSILAPNANLKLKNGNIEGQVIAQSAELNYWSGEFHNYEFQGKLPEIEESNIATNPQEVPEPSILLGLFSVGGILKLSNRKSITK